MGELLERYRKKFEWYRMCLPKKHREVFDKILDKSNEEEALRAVPGQTWAIAYAIKTFEHSKDLR